MPRLLGALAPFAGGLISRYIVESSVTLCVVVVFKAGGIS
jgi:hypothetical protein